MQTVGKKRIQPLDLILLRGVDPISKAMQCRTAPSIDHHGYSHAAVAISREVLDLPCLEPGRIYLWESTLSASPSLWKQLSWPLSTSQVRSMRFGVQLRDLEWAIAGYEAAGDVDHCSFLGQLPPRAEIRQMLAALHEAAPLAHYPAEMLETFGILFPELQATSHLKPNQGEVTREALLSAAQSDKAATNAEQFIFCTDWAAQVYAKLGIVDFSDPAQAAPADFLDRTDLFASPQALTQASSQGDASAGETAGMASQRPGFATEAQQQQLKQKLSTFAAKQATSVGISDDQRIAIEFREDTAQQLQDAERWLAEDAELAAARPRAIADVGDTPAPMNIAILISGTRGDVQPFIGIGRKLQQDGHRVRLATHTVFRIMVEANGLEFFPLGGDPKELISYMVRTGGKIIPNRLDLLIDEVPKKRRMVAELIDSTWDACTKADPWRPEKGAFTADAIIANPPAFGHYNVAERLGAPLHMVMTLPWSPTRVYPHPLANMDFTRQNRIENWLSYGLVDGLTFTGVGDIITRFRRRLGLPKISLASSVDYLNQHAVPFTYLWSPSLLPRPNDWGSHIDIANFIFYEQADTYQPPDELAAFLDADEPPIYVGFGSIVVQDPEGLTEIIFNALAAAGRRGIVSAGWGGLGNRETPENVLMINECPHDWLFPRCSAICHHGGAGTTSTALRAGKPNIIVPFFGDQFFWGPIVAQAGAGPKPIAIGELTSARLTAAFKASADPAMSECAQSIGASLRATDGAELTVQSFYRQLPTTADGIIAYLGFDASDRKRLRNGEIALKPLRNQTTQGMGHAVAARIERPLEEVFADCRSGRELDMDPLTFAFGELNEQASPADFERAGLDASDTEEIEALLLARPGDQFNFSEHEYQALARFKAKHSDWSLDQQQITTLNTTLATMLYQRYVAYRQAGLNGIAPYARADGKQSLPAEVLRQALPPNSVFAQEFPQFRRALLEYPSDNETFDSRFYWVKQEIAGQRSRGLLHKQFLAGDEYCAMSMRWYYMDRGLDVLHTIVGFARQGDATLVVSVGRTTGTQLAGRVSGKWHRWRTRNDLDDAAIRIIEALR